MSSYALCIPCYNCQPQIERMIFKLNKTHIPSNVDIIFIENKSEDTTREYLLKNISSLQHPKKTLILNSRNYGLGGSFKICIEHTEAYDFLIWLHGDDQVDLSDLTRMLMLNKKNNFDCIFGARFTKESQLKNYSLIRRLGNLTLNMIFSLALATTIYETGSGLNLYKLSKLDKEDVKRWPEHIAFDLNLLFHFLSENHKIKWLPISWQEEDQVSNASNIRVGLQMLMDLFRFKFNKLERLQVIPTYEYEVMN